MKKSDSIKELAGALCNVQGALKPAQFNSTNPFLKNRYADLGAVIESSKDLLAKNGLAVSQLVTSDTDRIGVETVLMHSSGEWLSSEIFLVLGEERGKSSAQVAGSIITYMRRYALAAVLGIYADEDTDGNDHKQEQKSPAVKTEPKNSNAGSTTVGYPKAVIDAVVEAGHAKNVYEASGMLKHSILPADVKPEWAVAWSRVYRSGRDNKETPMTVEEAAQAANGAYLTAVRNGG